MTEVSEMRKKQYRNKSKKKTHRYKSKKKTHGCLIAFIVVLSIFGFLFYRMNKWKESVQGTNKSTTVVSSSSKIIGYWEYYGSLNKMDMITDTNWQNWPKYVLEIKSDGTYNMECYKRGNLDNTGKGIWSLKKECLTLKAIDGCYPFSGTDSFDYKDGYLIPHDDDYKHMKFGKMN